MGYYANYSGSIETKPMSRQDVKRFLAAIDSEEITGLLTMVRGQRICILH